jgi:hypothetical protein
MFLWSAGIAPRILRPRHQMEMSAHLHSQAALPAGKEPPVSIGQEAGGGGGGTDGLVYKCKGKVVPVIFLTEHTP